MADITHLERKLAALEARVDLLVGEATAPKPKPPLLRRIVSLETARNLVYLVAFPALLFTAWLEFESEILNWRETRLQERRAAAVEKIGQLQLYQAYIYELQAQDRNRAAFARLDATRGQQERMAHDLYAFWQQDPDAFLPSEKVALVGVLLSTDMTEKAVNLAASVDVSDMGTIEAADWESLKARVLFARGPLRDIEAARDAMRRAMQLAANLPDDGQKISLMEKFAAIRLVNELWIGSSCDEVAAFHGFLSDIVADGVPDAQEDPVRANTLDALAAHDLKCG